jgi:hypothetical protein
VNTPLRANDFPIDPQLPRMDDIIDFTERMLLTSFQQPQEEPHHFNNEYWMSTAVPAEETIATTMTKQPSSEQQQEDLLPLVTPSKEESLSSLPMRQDTVKQIMSSSTDSEDENTASIIAEKFPSTGVDIPSKFDILCGQSRICSSHAGNRRFQIVLDLYAEKYDSVTSKQEKMNLTKEIVACIRNSGGRFLKYKNGSWTEITDVLARDKVSHALRTKVASWKRQKEEASSAPQTSSTAQAAIKKTHRRKNSSGSKRRGSSTSIVTTSFDAGDSTEKTTVMEELLKAQREIFASLMEGVDGDDDIIHPLKL